MIEQPYPRAAEAAPGGGAAAGAWKGDHALTNMSAMPPVWVLEYYDESDMVIILFAN